MKSLVASFEPSVTIVSEIISTIGEALEAGQRFRSQEFLKTVETRYELMNPEEKKKFKECIKSPNGQKIIADFAVAVATTPSIVVNSALALLYANDPDFPFNSHEVERFVSSTLGLTDRKVSFLLSLNKVEQVKTKSLYPAYSISEENFVTLGDIIDVDELFIYVSDFQSRGLLLMETNQQKAFGFAEANENIKWSAKYCISDTQHRFISLLRKASEYVA
ncbi:hypothetical protein ACFFUS_20400 [Vibrio gallaecicus]|uniref:hypothetical protein n=1 Tax=Vibrio gallaecicus TaxID=552386 RepID=UPI0010C9F644|nr:hypothetical protein [Vibrio gallaecicus]MDN3617479.1 hypothetical protein [Vibrio gallaecicus]